MYQTMGGYRACIDDNSRPRFRALVKLEDGTVFTDEIKSAELTSGVVAGDTIGIGNAVAACLKLTLVTGIPLENQYLEYVIYATLPSGELVYIPIGCFTVETVERSEDVVTMTAYDNLKRMDIPYVSALTYPTSAADVAAELSHVTGVEIEPDVVIPDLQIKSPISGYTAREAAGKLAERMGCNAVANRFGRLEFRWFVETPILIDADNRHYEFKMQDYDYTLGCIACVTGESSSLTSGEGKGISIDNPDMTQAELDALLDKLRITYRGCTCSFLGDPTLDAGDIITVSDLSGAPYSVPIMQMVMTYDGGIKCDIEAYAETDTQVETQQGATVTKRLSDLKQDLDGFAFVVGREYATKEYLQSQLTMAADQIALSVSQSLNGDTLIARINLAPGEVTIDAKKINLKGYATFTDLEGSGACTINGANITAGTVMSKNYLKRDAEGNLVLDAEGNAIETGEGVLLNLDNGFMKFAGSYDYAWMERESGTHKGVTEMFYGRIRVYDEAVGYLYISAEGISTNLDGVNASGCLDYRSHLFGFSALGNEYNGVSLISNGSPCALVSRQSDVIIDPHMDSRAGGPEGNKFAFTIRETGDGVIYFGPRVYDEEAKKFVYSCGIQFASDPEDGAVYAVDKDGNKDKGKIYAANIPKAITEAAVTRNASGRITKLACTTEDGSRVSLPVEYDADGNITKIGDTIFD